uniref:Centrosomal protein 170Bb n=1 Tax=Callorhinchus milii TaxID=7868 RepID=A0A4W3JEH1_CALMI
MSVTSWFLVSTCGSRHRLPKEMIFVGREDCELMLQSRSVDKQHAVINYDLTTDEHRVKDLGSLNGTFVNDIRIPDQMYITLKVKDTIRFGYDILLKKMMPINGCILFDPFCSCFFVLDGATFRPTPLYGQPSWWGDDDLDNKREGDETRKSADPSIGIYQQAGENAVYSFRREPSYFEIPTKEFQQLSKSPECEVHEIPTKDTDTIASPPVQSHASFTIEFDDCTPGKMKIKNHVTKFSLRQRKTQQVEKGPVQTDVQSAESKVVDWLVQNDPSLMIKRQVPRDDVYSTKSDLQVHIKTLKGSRHEDGTQSDSEDQVGSNQLKKSDTSGDSSPNQIEVPITEPPKAHQITHGTQDVVMGQQAFVIEFFDDDNPRKRRAHSFTQNANAAHTDLYAALKTKLEKRKGPSTCEKTDKVQQAQSLVQVSRPGIISAGPQRSSSLKREKTEERFSSSASSTSKGLYRGFGSVGRKSKLRQEFAAELLKETARNAADVQKSSENLPLMTPTNVTMAPTVSVSSPLPPAVSSPATVSPASQTFKQGEQDSLSDAGTYTIETDKQDEEVEEARKMIDQVRNGTITEVAGNTQQVRQHLWRKESTVCNKLQDVFLFNIFSYLKLKMRPVGPVSHGTQKWVSRWASLAASYNGSGPIVGSHDFQQSASEYYVSGVLDFITVPINSSSTRCSTVVPDTNHAVTKKANLNYPIGKMTKVTHRSPSQERKITFTKNSRTPVVRQESYTKDKSSIDAGYKIPNISSQPTVKEHVRSSIGTDCSDDTHFILKETEAAMAALEAKLHSQSRHLSQPESNVCVQGDSLSGESDNDTGSSVSLVSKNGTSSGWKQKSFSGIRKEQSSSAPSVSDQHQQPNARERLSEKRKAQLSDATTKPNSTRRFQLKRSAGSHGSMDFTDDERSSSLPYLPVTDIGSSDQEHAQASCKPFLRKKLSLRTKEESNKAAKSSIQTTLTRSNSLSTPRPTRASLLRRARLGDASDNEGADVEMSTTTPNSKQPPDSKKLTRLDLLALPRKRAGSFSVNSDTESSVVRSSFSGRSVDLTTISRKLSTADAKKTSRKTTGNVMKQTSRVRSASSKSATNSRWRQQTSDYTSTSEEEYGSSHTSPKHRLHTSTATHGSRSQSCNSGRQRQNTKEMEDDEDEDSYENWTTHSAEIARLSQDLAKDLAILAREIHDVAGDGDCFSPLSPALPKSSTPGSMISAREELVQHIPEASLNFQKVPPESSGIKKDLDQNLNDNKDPDSKRRTWTREEVILDNLMWNSVSQLSQYIRENMEQTAAKIKILFQNKERNWEEIEAKINSENEVPILKTSNKEISSIFKDLRRVQKQLEG